MNCTQKQQLVCFPKVRVYKPWFRHFNDHKDFRNEGTVHLFSLMALFSYANFRSNERVIYGDRYMEAPGQWICKLGALPRILRVHSKAQALELMEYFRIMDSLPLRSWMRKRKYSASRLPIGKSTAHTYSITITAIKDRDSFSSRCLSADCF